MKSISASKAPCADPDSSPERIKYHNLFLFLSLTTGCLFSFLSTVRLWRLKTPLVPITLSIRSSLTYESLPFALKASACVPFRVSLLLLT